jgi:hypothetical protein
MIKRHSVTGMKYFCKTILQPESKMLSYKGSGKIWLKHIKKHGKQHVVTDWFQLFVNRNECTQFAIKFSKDNNIVLSNEWANLIEENGLDGGNKLPCIVFTPEHRRKLSESAKRRTHKYSHGLETRQKISEVLKSKKIVRTKEQREKLRIANLGHKHTEKTKQKMRGPRGKLSHLRKPRSNLFLVSQIDINGNIIKTDHVSSFIHDGFTRSRISECYNKKITSYKGYFWEKIIPSNL